MGDRPGIDKLIDTCHPRIGVICAAGERGRPNIAWCDKNPVATVDANVTGQLNVAAAAHARGLHCTLIGTGQLYQPDSAFPRSFSESDPPNADLGVYGKLRSLLEHLVVQYGFDN